MAVAAWTPKQVVDLLPEFLSKRIRTFAVRFEGLAADLGVSRLALNVLNNGLAVAGEDGRVTLARHRWRSPYATKDIWSERWAENVAAGLAERSGDGWRVTPKGLAAALRLNEALRGHLASLALPSQPLGDAVRGLEPLAARIPASSPRVAAARRHPAWRLDPGPTTVRLNLAVTELWLRRDDCHIGAWQDAGYAGPALDVLTQVWEGRASLDDVAKALEAKEDRADVEQNAEALVQRGDLAREGTALRLTAQGRAARDGIETETDRRYFADWPSGDELGRIGDALRALIDAIP